MGLVSECFTDTDTGITASAGFLFALTAVLKLSSQNSGIVRRISLQRKQAECLGA